MSRVLTISDEITKESVKDIITAIQVWNVDDNKSDDEKKNFKREPIHIMINSNGGDAYSGFGLATMIKSSKTPIYTYCPGEAMSAGLVIFLGGHKRYCYKGSSFLYHQLSVWNDNKLDNLNRSVSWFNDMEKRVDKFVIENTKITQQQINDVNEKNHDWYISPDEALELGIVDEIL